MENNRTVNDTVLEDEDRKGGESNWEEVTIGVLGTLTFVSNLLVLVAVQMHRKSKNRMFYFIKHSCIADMITAVFTDFSQLIWRLHGSWQGGNVLCKIVLYLQPFGMVLSSYIFAMMALDRYQAICHPLSDRTWSFKKSKIMIFVAWSISILICIPQMINYSLTLEGGEPNCIAKFIEPWGEKAYVTWYSIAFFFVPLFVVSYAYWNITRTIWRNFASKNRASRCEREERSRLRSQSPTKAVLQARTRFSFNGAIGKKIRSFRKKDAERAQPAEVETLDHGVPSLSDLNIDPRTSSMRGISKAKIKTLKLTFTVISCFIVCSLPFISTVLWVTWDPDARFSAFFRGPGAAVLAHLAALNSCINPFIYLFFNPNLVTTMKEWVSFLHCACPGCIKSTVSRTRDNEFSEMTKNSETVVTTQATHLNETFIKMHKLNSKGAVEV